MEEAWRGEAAFTSFRPSAGWIESGGNRAAFPLGPQGCPARLLSHPVPSAALSRPSCHQVASLSRRPPELVQRASLPASWTGRFFGGWSSRLSPAGRHPGEPKPTLTRREAPFPRSSPGTGGSRSERRQRTSLALKSRQSIRKKKAGRPRARASEPRLPAALTASGLLLRLRWKGQGGSAMAPLLGGPLRRFPPGAKEPPRTNPKGNVAFRAAARRVVQNCRWEKQQTTCQPRPHPAQAELGLLTPWLEPSFGARDHSVPTQAD